MSNDSNSNVCNVYGSILRDISPSAGIIASLTTLVLFISITTIGS